MNRRKALFGLLPDEIPPEYNLSPKFRGVQVFSAIWKGSRDFSEITVLPLGERERLKEEYGSIPRTGVREKLEAEDGSVKLKIMLEDGGAVEAVLLSDRDERLTACLSTQLGCQMACAFCKTGSLGFSRNLLAHEIVEQFIHLMDLGRKPSNIVFMGMGEPLLNLDELRKAIEILRHPQGGGISSRKITVSTCGIVPGILDLAENGPYLRLAVSLTSANDKLRSELMPVNRRWNLGELKNALLVYQQKSGDRITVEAAIMGGVNSDLEAAKEMAAWLDGLKVQLNIIPWNPIPGFPFREPSEKELALFMSELGKLGINTVKRSEKGRKVGGACGQLGETLRAD